MGGSDIFEEFLGISYLHLFKTAVWYTLGSDSCVDFAMDDLFNNMVFSSTPVTRTRVASESYQKVNSSKEELSVGFWVEPVRNHTSLF